MIRTPFLPKLRAPLLMGLAGALAGSGLGYFGRRMLTPPAPGPSPAAATAAAVSASQSPGASLGLSGKPDSRSAPGAAAVAGKAGVISAALAGDKGVDYWLHLLSVADGAPAGVLGQLIDALKNEPSALKLLGTRWAQLDPGGMFTALSLRDPKHNADNLTPGPETELQKILAGEWFRQNPSALIKALSGTRGADSLRSVREELLRLLGPQDPRQTLELLVNWELPLVGFESNVLTPWLRAHPQEAMRLLMARRASVFQAGDPGSGTLREIAQAVADTDPAAALSKSPEAMPSLQASFEEHVMRAWAARDLTAARDWLSSPEVNWKKRNRLSQGLLKVWAKTDPSAAMAWADSQLTGRTKIQACSTLIPAMAAQDPDGTLEYVRQLNPGFARDEAVLHMTNTLLGNRGKPEALKAFQQLTALSDPALRQTALGTAAYPMMQVAPQEFLAWLASPEGAAAPYEAFSRTADSLAEKDGASAMTWAAGLRPEVAGGIRQSILSTWLRENPEAARTWVAALPDGPERRSSVALTTSSIAYQRNLGNSTAWLATLPASDHPAILTGLSNAGDLDHTLQAELQAKYR